IRVHLQRFRRKVASPTAQKTKKRFGREHSRLVAPLTVARAHSRCASFTKPRLAEEAPAVASLHGYRTATARLSHPRRSDATAACRQEGPPRRAQPRDDPDRVSARIASVGSDGAARLRRRSEARNNLLS